MKNHGIIISYFILAHTSIYMGGPSVRAYPKPNFDNFRRFFEGFHSQNSPAPPTEAKPVFEVPSFTFNFQFPSFPGSSNSPPARTPSVSYTEARLSDDEEYYDDTTPSEWHTTPKPIRPHRRRRTSPKPLENHHPSDPYSGLQRSLISESAHPTLSKDGSKENHHDHEESSHTHTPTTKPIMKLPEHHLELHKLSTEHPKHLEHSTKENSARSHYQSISHPESGHPVEKKHHEHDNVIPENSDLPSWLAAEEEHQPHVNDVDSIHHISTESPEDQHHLGVTEDHRKTAALHLHDSTVPTTHATNPSSIHHVSEAPKEPPSHLHHTTTKSSDGHHDHVVSTESSHTTDSSHSLHMSTLTPNHAGQSEDSNHFQTTTNPHTQEMHSSTEPHQRIEHHVVSVASNPHDLINHTAATNDRDHHTTSLPSEPEHLSHPIELDDIFALHYNELDEHTTSHITEHDLHEQNHHTMTNPNDLGHNSITEHENEGGHHSTMHPHDHTTLHPEDHHPMSTEHPEGHKPGHQESHNPEDHHGHHPMIPVDHHTSSTLEDHHITTHPPTLKHDDVHQTKHSEDHHTTIGPHDHSSTTMHLEHRNSSTHPNEPGVISTSHPEDILHHPTMHPHEGDYKTTSPSDHVPRVIVGRYVHGLHSTESPNGDHLHSATNNVHERDQHAILSEGQEHRKIEHSEGATTSHFNGHGIETSTNSNNINHQPESLNDHGLYTNDHSTHSSVGVNPGDHSQSALPEHGSEPTSATGSKQIPNSENPHPTTNVFKADSSTTVSHLSDHDHSVAPFQSNMHETRSLDLGAHHPTANPNYHHDVQTVLNSDDLVNPHITSFPHESQGHHSVTEFTHREQHETPSYKDVGHPPFSEISHLQETSSVGPDMHSFHPEGDYSHAKTFLNEHPNQQTPHIHAENPTHYEHTSLPAEITTVIAHIYGPHRSEPNNFNDHSSFPNADKNEHNVSVSEDTSLRIPHENLESVTSVPHDDQIHLTTATLSPHSQESASTTHNYNMITEAPTTLHSFFNHHINDIWQNQPPTTTDDDDDDDDTTTAISNFNSPNLHNPFIGHLSGTTTNSIKSEPHEITPVFPNSHSKNQPLHEMTPASNLDSSTLTSLQPKLRGHTHVSVLKSPNFEDDDNSSEETGSTTIAGIGGLLKPTPFPTENHASHTETIPTIRPTEHLDMTTEQASTTDIIKAGPVTARSEGSVNRVIDPHKHHATPTTKSDDDDDNDDGVESRMPE